MNIMYDQVNQFKPKHSSFFQKQKDMPAYLNKTDGTYQKPLLTIGSETSSHLRTAKYSILQNKKFNIIFNINDINSNRPIIQNVNGSLNCLDRK